MENEQLEQLLLNLPQVKKFIFYSNSLTIDLSKLNNQTFLKKFRQNCPAIKVFEVNLPRFNGSYQLNDYESIRYALRHTISTAFIGNNTNLYEQMTSFPQMEHIFLYNFEWNAVTFLQFLSITKELPQLKSLKFYMNGCEDWFWNVNENDEYEEIGYNYVQIELEKDQMLIKRLAEFEKLDVFFSSWNPPCNTNLITQYFVGLKELIMDFSWPYDLSSETYAISYNQLFKYACSHNQYNVTTSNYDIKRITNFDVFHIPLQHHFSHLFATKKKSISNHLEILLDAKELTYSSGRRVNYGHSKLKLEIECKEYNYNQLLKLAKFTLGQSETNAHVIFELLNENKTVMENIDTLILKIYDGKAYFPFNSFRLFGDILSMTINLLKIKLYISNRFDGVNIL